MNEKSHTAGEILRRLSSEDFLKLGVQQVAYIRPTFLNGIKSFTIHGADGIMLGFHEDESVARALTLESDLYPVQLH